MLTKFNLIFKSEISLKHIFFSTKQNENIIAFFKSVKNYKKVSFLCYMKLNEYFK